MGKQKQKEDQVLDPTRSEEREAVAALKDDGVDLKIVDAFEIVKYNGERKYFSTSKKDAEDRLVEMASGSSAIGSGPSSEPVYTVRECRAVEVEAYEKDAPESRTRGPHSGAPADEDDADADTR